MLNQKTLIAAVQGDQSNLLGKLLYFSLSNILVDKTELSELCDSMGIYYGSGKRLSVTDAFRSATGDVKDRIVVKQAGEQQIYQIYCRDNRRARASIISRELVKETMNRQTNQYEKLANISFDKDTKLFRYDNLVFDPEVDAAKYCRQAEELFELYQTCANRRQIETICVRFLRSLDATKLSINGHLYFVPHHTMEQVDLFEDFIAEVSKRNRTNNSIMANSIYVIDDAKQRDKMTEEFYSAVKKEIAEYQERCSRLLQSGCQSPSIMERWVLKIQGLEEKKHRYEQVLHRELDQLDDEFSALKLLSQEFHIRICGMRNAA